MGVCRVCGDPSLAPQGSLCFEHGGRRRGSTTCRHCGGELEETFRSNGVRRLRCRPCEYVRQRDYRNRWRRLKAAKERAAGISSRAQQRGLRKLVPVLRDRDGDDCCICGEPLVFDPISAVHVEHRWPRSRGGDDRLDNLGLAHASCNVRKRGTVDDELEAWARAQGLLCAGLYGFHFRRRIEVRPAHREGPERLADPT